MWGMGKFLSSYNCTKKSMCGTEFPSYGDCQDSTNWKYIDNWKHFKTSAALRNTPEKQTESPPLCPYSLFSL